MPSISSSRFFLYYSIKWICIYAYYVVTGVLHSAGNLEGWFLGAFVLTMIPVRELLFLAIPFYYALTRRGSKMWSLLLCVFALELILDTIHMSELSLGVIVKVLFSLFLFLLIYQPKVISEEVVVDT